MPSVCNGSCSLVHKPPFPWAVTKPLVFQGQMLRCDELLLKRSFSLITALLQLYRQKDDPKLVSIFLGANIFCCVWSVLCTSTQIIETLAFWHWKVKKVIRLLKKLLSTAKLSESLPRKTVREGWELSFLLYNPKTLLFECAPHWNIFRH